MKTNFMVWVVMGVILLAVCKWIGTPTYDNYQQNDQDCSQDGFGHCN